MKTSNKIFLGLFIFLALNALTSMLIVRNSLGPAGIGKGATIVEGKGPTKKVRKEIPAFEGLIVGDNFHINLVQGERFLEIEAQENLLDKFNLEVKDKKLWIEAKEAYTLIPGERILVTVGFEDLRSFEMHGNSNVSTSSEVLKLTDCQIQIHGLGKFDLPLEAQKLNLQVHGSGRATFSGTVENLFVSVSGSGEIEAESLKATKAEAHISGAGWLKLNVVEFLNAHISGSGSIEYVGNPNVRKHISGAGRISQK